MGAVWLDSSKDVTVTAYVLLRLGVMREEQMLSYEIGATEDVSDSESEASETTSTSDCAAAEGVKLKGLVAREVASATKQLARKIEKGFECQMSHFEQRMRTRIETEGGQESRGDKLGRSNAVTKSLKALPGRGISKALSRDHMI